MDKERILIKFRELEGYLEELEEIKPLEFEDYIGEKKRACERLLQISIETIIDISNILVSNLKLGMPADEEDMLKKLETKKIISKNMKEILSSIKGMRNILVHKYGEIKDEIVFEIISDKLQDFDKFKEEILKFLKKE